MPHDPPPADSVEGKIKRAVDDVGAEDKGITRDKFLRWTLGIALSLSLFLLAVAGQLVNRDDPWGSWILWLPAAVIVVPILIGAVRRSLSLKRFLTSLVSALIMLVILLVMVNAGGSEYWFANVFGNETLGPLGWMQNFYTWGWPWWIAWLGWIVVAIGAIALAVAAPLLLLGLFDTLSFEEDFSIFWAIFLAILAPLACVFAIGWSIIRIMGW